MTKGIINFRNPVTRRPDSAAVKSGLGRAALRVREAPKSRAARRALRVICAEIQRQDDIAVLRRSESAQRAALVKAAVRSGRTISWRVVAIMPWFPAWNDHVHGSLVPL